MCHFIETMYMHNRHLVFPQPDIQEKAVQESVGHKARNKKQDENIDAEGKIKNHQT